MATDKQVECMTIDNEEVAREQSMCRKDNTFFMFRVRSYTR